MKRKRRRAPPRHRQRCAPRFRVLPSGQCVIAGMEYSDMRHLLTCATLNVYSGLSNAEARALRANIEPDADSHVAFWQRWRKIVEGLGTSATESLAIHNAIQMRRKLPPPVPETLEQRKARLREDKRIHEIIDDAVADARADRERKDAQLPLPEKCCNTCQHFRESYCYYLLDIPIPDWATHERTRRTQHPADGTDCLCHKPLAPSILPPA